MKTSNEPQIATDTDRENNFEARRQNLLDKMRPMLAHPVALLVATAYEPRIDNAPRCDEFDAQVSKERQRLRKSIQDLSSNQGGKIEAIALQTVERLLEKAIQYELDESVQALKASIDRGREVRKPEQPKPAKLPAIDRVLGSAGRPIGLWR